jgi:threonine dehydrogenase-like Zn-dependent dehydrogenase
MRGIVFRGDRELELQHFPDPTPGPEEVVVEVRASGMCGSDLHEYRKPKGSAPNVIAGHEPAGVIVAVGDTVPTSWVGRAVMIHHYIGCNRCDQCRAGWAHLCRQELRALALNVHGGHADFIKMPFSSVMPLPEGLSFQAAAAISCGTGTAWGALEMINVRGDDTIAIFGQGPVGLSATQLATAMGAKVIALDIEPKRLQRAQEFGAAETINPREVDSVQDAVLALTGGRGVTKALETSAAPIATQQALQVLGLWGAVCWIGRGASLQVDLTEQLTKQITAKTSWTLSSVQMAHLADFVLDRSIDVDALFTERWTLDRAAEAYQWFDRQSDGKGVFLPKQ